MTGCKHDTEGKCKNNCPKKPKRPGNPAPGGAAGGGGAGPAGPGGPAQPGGPKPGGPVGGGETPTTGMPSPSASPRSEALWRCRRYKGHRSCERCGSTANRTNPSDCNMTASECHAACGGEPTSASQSSCTSCQGGGQASSSNSRSELGFGFIASGSVKAPCACDSSYAWKKRGDHPCGCSGTEKAAESAGAITCRSGAGSHRVGENVASELFYARGGLRAPALASAALHSECADGDGCPCCLESMCITVLPIDGKSLYGDGSASKIAMEITPTAIASYPGNEGARGSCHLAQFEAATFTPTARTYTSWYIWGTNRWNVAYNSGMRGSQQTNPIMAGAAYQKIDRWQGSCGDKRVNIDGPRDSLNWDWRGQRADFMAKAILFFVARSSDAKKCSEMGFYEVCCGLMYVAAGNDGTKRAMLRGPVCGPICDEIYARGPDDYITSSVALRASGGEAHEIGLGRCGGGGCTAPQYRPTSSCW
jgi:hypothetical protein